MRGGPVLWPWFQLWVGHSQLLELLWCPRESVRACVYFLSPRRSLAPSLQIGLCGFNAFHPCPLSQLPTVPAQILPSALRGDVIQWGAGPPRTLSKHGAVCVAQKGKGFPSSPVHVKITPAAFCSTFLTEKGKRAFLLWSTFKYVTFIFILLWRGLERICEYQTKVCSPGGSTQTHRLSEVEGTISIIWSDWGLERGSDMAKITEQVSQSWS